MGLPGGVGGGDGDSEDGLEASSAQVGPSVWREKDVGVHDMNSGHGQERTLWASQLGISATSGGHWQELVTGQSLGWFRHELPKWATPL